MSSRMVENMRILFENIFFMQFCFAVETFVCFAVCCISDWTPANCFGFLNCFVSPFNYYLSHFPSCILLLFPNSNLIHNDREQFHCQLHWGLAKAWQLEGLIFNPHLTIRNCVMVCWSPFLTLVCFSFAKWSLLFTTTKSKCNIFKLFGHQASITHAPFFTFSDSEEEFSSFLPLVRSNGLVSIGQGKPRLTLHTRFPNAPPPGWLYGCAMCAVTQGPRYWKAACFVWLCCYCLDSLNNY